MKTLCPLKFKRLVAYYILSHLNSALTNTCTMNDYDLMKPFQNEILYRIHSI